MKRKRNSNEASSSNCLSSIEATTSHKFDVFLSFRGPDTRDKFTSHLYECLTSVGISVFKDDVEMVKGEGINEALRMAISHSKICIPIFSKIYASSKACLQELSHMVLEDKSIIPIFYDVGVDDVKLKTDLYRKALEDHHKEDKVGKEEIKEWEKALLGVAKILGYNVADKNEANEIKKVTGEVLKRLVPKDQNLTNRLVKIDDEVESVIEMLDLNSNGCCIVGLCGMGGIGKTTLAKIVFNRLLTDFNNCCSFIANVRESVKNDGLLKLQEQLYKDLINPSFAGSLNNINNAINMIKRGLEGRRFLLVLDDVYDVDDQDLLTKFVGDHSRLANGSRIIITTRDNRFLDVLRNNLSHVSNNDRILLKFHEVHQLDDNQALQLFSRYAFLRDSPPEKFMSLSKEVISSLGGLPLALEVIGSLLFNRSKEIWVEIMERLNENLEKKIQTSLMISYHKLHVDEQKIFLDIACYPGSLEKREAYYMWKSCGWRPNVSIDSLINHSLVKIEDNEYLRMHDVLKDLGRDIIREKHGRQAKKFLQISGDFGKIPNEGRKYVEMLKLVSYSKPVTSNDLKGFENVRFLQLDANKIDGNFEGLLPNLRWIHSSGVEDFTATDFYLKNVVVLRLQHLKDIKPFWSKMKAHKLKVLQISQTYGVESMSFNEFSSLEVLDLSYAGINVLPNAIWQLKELRILQISGSPITRFPPTIDRLMKLEELAARHCTKFGGDIPFEISKLSCLRIFDLRGTPVRGISKLPSSLTHLHIDSLADDFEISSHNLLELVNCVELKLGSSLSSYRIGDPNERLDFQWIESLPMLEKLYLRIPCTITGLENVSRLSRLEELILYNAELSDNLQLPSRLSYLRLNGCKCDILDVSHAKKLTKLHIWRCDIPKILVKELDSLVQLQVQAWRSPFLLKLWKCKNLKELQLFNTSSFLIDLSIRDCPSLEFGPIHETNVLISSDSCKIMKKQK